MVTRTVRAPGRLASYASLARALPAKARIAGRMHYRDFLGQLHRELAPDQYFEIGVRRGDSLALARCASIGVDPAYELTVPVGPSAHLERMTSDEYFAAERPDLSPDLSFIDGMHLSEFALRDFINVERHSSWHSVVVFDDVLPLHAEDADRSRHTWDWTGDVFRVCQVIEEYRPDLTVLLVDTRPTGLMLVTGLDPASTALSDAYDRIVDTHVRDDPQDVPRDVLRRVGALDAQSVLRSGIWSVLRSARSSGRAEPGALAAAVAALRSGR